jgi:hypothetical protein
MITIEDCRRNAEKWLNAALAESDPKTSASMRHVSGLWLALGQQIDQSAASATRLDTFAKRPADLAKSRKFHYVDGVQVADVLRARLHLNRELFKR